MIKLFNVLLRAIMVTATGTSLAWGQTAQQQGITNTTQILDTSVLFAIGAREAEQAIRGSFGWPTFQEGFVDRVYFRFDPDGYARFSESPRLDEDVFEVICAESSTSCKAQKPSLEIGLTVEGKVQILLSDVTPNDTFFVSDRKSELPLPPSILDPLDSRLETLLSSGGHLIIKRELETVQQISLSGFSAVATYLRWVAQGQSPRVFPRGWPAPAQLDMANGGTLTQPGLWNAPTAGPQNSVTTFASSMRQNLDDERTSGFQNTRQTNQAAWQTQEARPPISGQSFQTPVSQSGPSADQLAIAALQQELFELRREERSVNGVASQDFQRSFEQQAQSRNLQEVSGYGLPSLSEGDKELSVNFSGSVLPVQRKDLTAVYDQIYALEKRLASTEDALHRVMLTARRDTKRTLWDRPQEQQIEVQASDRKITGEPQSMDDLEELLLERLSKRDVYVEPTSEISTSLQEESVKSERQQILELLGEITNQHKDEVEPSKPSEGFVSLSDYIKQMVDGEK